MKINGTRLLPLTVLAIAIFAPAAMTQHPATPPAPDSVSIRCTVRNKSDQPIHNFKQTDFILSDDGGQLRVIDFTQDMDAPTAMAVVLDASLSQQRVLPLNKAAAQAFVRHSVRAAKDLATIMSFSHSVWIDHLLTDSVDQLVDAIETVDVQVPPGYAGGVILSPNPTRRPMPGSSGLWDTLMVATEKLSQTEKTSRRAILLFSDGVDTSSRASMNDALAHAIKNGVSIYAVGTVFRDPEIDRGNLKRLAETTGGRAYFPKREEMGSVLMKISEELRAQYLIKFQANPTTDQKKPYRNLKVKLAARNKDELLLACPRGYSVEKLEI